MQRVWFCFLTGNEDMHLKNWELLSRSGRISLSTARDLLNTSSVLKKLSKKKLWPSVVGTVNATGETCPTTSRWSVADCPPDLRQTDLEKLLLQAEEEWPFRIRCSFLSEPKREAYLHSVRDLRAALRADYIERALFYSSVSK